MKRRQALTLLAAGALAPAAPCVFARGVPAEVERAIPGARLLGDGRLRWFGMHIYDARLWVAPGHPSGTDYAGHPLALELEYARALDGARIAERSIEEMRRAGALPDAQAGGWLTAMKQCFPDVKPGDRITGLQRPGEPTRFFVNGELACELADPEFARRFFGIWLGPDSSQPALRSALLGGAR
ncbi:chalcone isomerase family protein [Rivibacter subsaxonicus]|uniref:Chalcone isomerase-like protein n=1 Tax=Rivibacter subsaxonicus TaxID=457575 RepID=A0A4Q7VVI9_9BURK|nr:chalcone isomerase family protein [Rivibacter subsaxonicus]RZU00650.1 chalcone isomerase-like protein [Rivibacter subsaxonicus]